MCTFITAVLPADADQARWAPIVARFRLGLSPQDNRSVEQQLGPNERYYAFDGNCHCDTPLGWRGGRAGAVDQVDAHRQRMIADYRRKGWSQAKVDRAIADATRARERSEAARVVSPGGELRDWCALLTALRREAKVRYVGLMVREYSGGLDARIELKRRDQIALAALDEEVLADLERDVLYLFA